jgi:5-methylcytosine-specific restriction endonuclease McrA
MMDSLTNRGRKTARKRLYRNGCRYCVYCGVRLVCCTLKGNERLTVDHVRPLADGGGSHDGNIVSSCSRCNVRKGSSGMVRRFDAKSGYALAGQVYLGDGI